MQAGRLHHKGTIMDNAEEKRAEILRLVGEYYAAAFADCGFSPGKDAVHYAGRVFDADELRSGGGSRPRLLAHRRPIHRGIRIRAGARSCRSIRPCWSTPARRRISWPSARLTSPALGDRRIRPGDEVITPAAGFPTTVNPIIQIGAVPVFIDVELATMSRRSTRSPRRRAEDQAP